MKKSVTYRGAAADDLHPAGQMQADNFRVAVSSNGDLATLASAIRERLTAIHHEALITDVRTMQRIVDNVVWRPRLFTILFGVFALIAVLVTVWQRFGK